MSTVLRPTSTRDALVAAIREQMITGGLRPGDHLTETMLATRFDVARPTVRSALQVLLSLGLADPSGRSVVVPVMDDEDVRDLFFVRTPLELAAVGAIVRNRASLDATEKALEEMRALPAKASWSEHADAHKAFHIALVNAAGSRRLDRVYPALQEELHLGLAHRNHEWPANTVHQHHELLRAIQSGHKRVAQAEMREHLDVALAAIFRA